MRARGKPWLALLVSWPLACHAGELDVPELGVRLADLPEGAAKPQVTEHSEGAEMTTTAGDALLSIYRTAAPEPAGSDVASPRYRASVDRRFGSDIDSKMQGAPTSLGGHSAWTIVDARPQSGHTLFLCVSYVIVDEHLYRLAVTATGTGHRPADFDALVRALSHVSFEPVHRTQASAARAGEAAR
jgi:hypothetical protein